MISRKESEQIVTSTPLPAVTASPRTPLPPPSLCMRGDSDFPWEAVRPRQEVRSRAERSGLRTWYRPCSVPTRRVTSSTTERSCCSSCSSWYSRGGPRTALPGREARNKTERLVRSPPGVGEEKTATSKIQREGKIEIVVFYSPVFARLAVKLHS